MSTALAPIDGGGIAQCTTGTAELLLRAGHEVSIAHVDLGGRDDVVALAREARDPVPADVRIVSRTPVPDWRRAGFTCAEHANADAAAAAVLALHGELPADLIVAAESHALAHELLVARAAGARHLRSTRIALRVCGGLQLVHRHDAVPLWAPETIAAWTMERAQFALADATIVPGPEIEPLTRALYGAEPLPSFAVIDEPHRLLPRATRVERGDGSLRLLVLGRLERMKGVLDLADALAAIGGDGWTLTLAGADTDTAPLGGSVADAVRAALAGDRLTIVPELSHAELPALLATADLVVIASTWETWSNALSDAVGSGVPVLVTPVGCLPRRVREARAGWVAPATGPDGLRAALAPLIASPAQVDALGARLRAGSPLRIDEPAFVRRHAALARMPLRAGERPALDDGVDVSAKERGPRGSRVTIERVELPAAGGRARAAAAALRESDADALLLVPAGVEVDAAFTPRAAALLAADPELAWVGCRLGGSRTVRPLGADPGRSCEANVVGCLPFVVRRAAAEEHGFDPRHDLLFDWLLLRRIAALGGRGLVIAEELATARDGFEDPLDALPPHLRRVAVAQMDVELERRALAAIVERSVAA